MIVETFFFFCFFVFLFWSSTSFQQVFFGLQLFFRKVPPLFPNSGSAPALPALVSSLQGFLLKAPVLGFCCVYAGGPCGVFVGLCRLCRFSCFFLLFVFYKLN